MNKPAMLEHIRQQDMEIFDLISKIIEIINEHTLWGVDEEYTFKDGEVWHRFDPDYEHAKNVKLINEGADNE